MVFSHTRRVQHLSIGHSDGDDPETYSFFSFVDAYERDTIHFNPVASVPSVFPLLRGLESTITSLHGVNHTVSLLKLASRNTQPSGGREEDISGTSHRSRLKSLKVSAIVPWTHHTEVQRQVDDGFMELAQFCHDLSSLERLEFRCDHLSPELELCFAKALEPLEAIQHVSIGLHKNALGHAVLNLAQHSKLRDLTLTFTKGPGAPDPHPTGPFHQLLQPTLEGLPSDAVVVQMSPANSFQALQSLTITADLRNVKDYLTFFNVPSGLLDLHLQTTLPSDNDLLRICEIISSTAVRLRTFRLEDNRLWVSHYPTIHRIAVAHALSPLLSLARLEAVILTLDCVMDLDDGDLKLMAEAWPRLRVLQISPWKEDGPVRPSNGGAAWPSLAGLKYLSDRCQALVQLSLKVDASLALAATRGALMSGGLNDQDSVGRRAKTTSCLRSWWIGASRLDGADASTVAQILRILFPQLNSLVIPGKPYDLVDGARLAGWSEISDALAKP